MDPKANYTVVGIFVIILSLVFVGIALWLSTGGEGKRYHTYLAYMSEAVSGLNVRAPVKYNGVQVGYVDQITLNPRDPQEVRLALKIQEGTPITESTRATLMSQGITGLTYVGLKAESASAPALKSKPGEAYPVIKTVPSLLFQLDKIVKRVTENVNAVTRDIREVLDQENRENFKKSLVNIRNVTDMLADNTQKLNEIITDTKTLMANTSKASVQFPKATTELRETLSSLREMGNSVSNAGKQGTIALRSLSQETLPSTQVLIEHLNSVAGNLDTLTQELKRNPSVIIRGKTPPPKGPGE